MLLNQVVNTSFIILKVCGSHNFSYQVLEKLPGIGHCQLGDLDDSMTQIRLKRKCEWALKLRTYYPQKQPSTVNLTKTIRNKILMYKETVQDISVMADDELYFINKTFHCDSKNSYCDPHHKHSHW